MAAAVHSPAAAQPQAAIVQPIAGDTQLIAAADPLEEAARNSDIRVAIEQYAKAKQLDVNKVTEKDVQESPEGLGHWAFQGRKVPSARSAEGQSFRRALSREVSDSGRPWSDVCGELLDGMKAKFRQDWMVKKSFEFTRDTRKVIDASRTTDLDEGEYMNALQIYKHLGGIDQPEARRQGDAYIEFCREAGGRMVAYNGRTQAETYLYVRRMLRIETIREFRMESEGIVEVNYLEVQLKESRAVRNYAAANNVTVSEALLPEIQSSKLGVEGWAELTIVHGAGQEGQRSGGVSKSAKLAICDAPQSKDSQLKSPPPRKKPGASPSAQKQKNTAAAQEKEAKAIASLMHLNKVHLDKIIEQASQDPRGWEWSNGFVKSIKAKMDGFKEKAVGISDFVAQFDCAAASPEALKMVKRSFGDNYTTRIMSYLALARGPAKEIDELVRKIQSMSDITQPSKRRRR